MFSQRLFTLISRLIFSRWARNYTEHHGSCEDVYVARIGPIHLEVNRCFVLDHDDARISLRIPTLRGKLHLGYVVCLGADDIRQPGFFARWQETLPKVVFGRAQRPVSDDDFPF